MHVLLKDNRAGLQLSHIIVFESGVRLHSRNENDGACKLLFVPASAENVKLSALVHKVCSSVDQLVYQQLSFPKSSERMRERLQHSTLIGCHSYLNMWNIPFLRNHLVALIYFDLRRDVSSKRRSFEPKYAAISVSTRWRAARPAMS